MTPDRSLFYWILRNRDDGRPLCLDGKRQRYTNVYDAAAMCQSYQRVVKVHARIPDPKLPAWVTPIAFHYRHVQVWRLSEGVCLQYVFSVSAAHVCLTESAVHRRAGVNRPSTPWDATADVWTEAAARAAKMLRAMKREKAGQK